MSQNLDTGQIKDWRSIITLIVFIITNINVLFPFHIPIYIPRIFCSAVLATLSALRVIPARQISSAQQHGDDAEEGGDRKTRHFVRLNFPMNLVTAPLIADLFLLAILAIGRQEVHDGIIGADNISPIDIMVFFITLAYIAISIDASGLIRYLAFKVLQKGGQVGHRLFFYLYTFFFALGTFIGNDPIILSGTAFIAYMTRVSDNIKYPRAWTYSQFAVANIAAAILVSSNPTNLVLARAFEIKFLTYTANMIVPVVITAVVLFPFLLYIIFADETLIPSSIKMCELPEEIRAKKPVNPNIPNARGNTTEQESSTDDEREKLNSLEEVLNPFLDKPSAAIGALIMAATLLAVLALNAASQSGTEHPVFWVTLPAAFVMFCWDIASGWCHRHETREIARKGRLEIELARADRASREEEAAKVTLEEELRAQAQLRSEARLQSQGGARDENDHADADDQVNLAANSTNRPYKERRSASAEGAVDEKQESTVAPSSSSPEGQSSWKSSGKLDEEKASPQIGPERERGRPTTLVSLVADAYRWSQETFPTVTAVFAHLPFALVPFSFCMFVLVQALVTKGWVAVFAHGWNHWVEKTGTVGSIAGMGFLSVILCNFAGTNIGTTILLSRVIQAWRDIHRINGTPISNRTFWATVYSMAIGVNYGAFSTALSASLAGLLWRDILSRKHIDVPSLEFARVNVPIIAISMAVGCTILVGEVYLVRDNSPYNFGGHS
ncbi:hypothetical protein VTO42DRAFT_3297 [Malbranchea cinnamomea]